jgi:hypothetical protein
VGVREYVQELLNFPNAAHDDQVDATTLALNQLRAPLFPKPKERAVETSDSQPPDSLPVPGYPYVIGWVPERSLNATVVVFDRAERKVVHFWRYPEGFLKTQICALSQLSRYYNRAVVRAFDRVNEALVSMLEMQSVLVKRVKFSQLEDSYENLAILMGNDMITVPRYPELQAELDVFTSRLTFDDSADYSLQVAQQSGIHALCLVTHDLSPALIHRRRQPSIYYSYDRYLIGDVHISW